MTTFETVVVALVVLGVVVAGYRYLTKKPTSGTGSGTGGGLGRDNPKNQKLH